ncbi:MAG: hypothetical protein AB1657_00885 [Candidatus Micrarchaeota archaeon]
MKKPIALFLFSLLLFAGCAKRSTESYSINSISLEGTRHMLGQSYEIYISLSPNAANSSLELGLFDNTDAGEEYASIILNDSNPLTDGKAKIEWDVHEDGPHTLAAKLFRNGTEAASRSISITAYPLGLREEDFPEVEFWHDPVERQIWQAQAFDLQASIRLRKAGFYLKYYTPPPENSTITVELRKDSGSLPSGELIADASIPASSLDTEFEWHFVSFPSLQLEPGRYWLILKRPESEGTVVWRRGPGNLIGSTDDTMVSDRTQGASGAWEGKDVDFVFQISSQD